MKFVFLIQARLTATRFPGKMLEKIGGNISLVEMVYRRVRLSKYATDENITILIPDTESNDPLAAHLSEKNITFWRGDENNVYRRFRDYLATTFLDNVLEKPDYVFRVCADNPFIEPAFLDDLAEYVKSGKTLADYISFQNPKTTTPAILTHFGFFAELIKFDAFMSGENAITNDVEREHVTPVFYKTGKFSTEFLPMPAEVIENDYRLTVDTPGDFDIVKKIFAELSEDFDYKNIIEVVRKNPELLAKMKENIEKNKK